MLKKIATIAVVVMMGQAFADTTFIIFSCDACNSGTTYKAVTRTYTYNDLGVLKSKSYSTSGCGSCTP